MLKVIRRALEDPTYDYRPMMNWEEGITEYLVSELKLVAQMTRFVEAKGEKNNM